MLNTNIRNLQQQGLGLLRVSIQPSLTLSKQFCASALNHVTKQRPRRTAEPNQRDLSSKFRSRQRNSIVDVSQLSLHINTLGEDLGVLRIEGRFEGGGKMRALFVNHLDCHAERLWDDKDVGEDYCGVDEAGVAGGWLEGYCGGDFGVAAAGEEVSVSFGFVVFWEVAAGYVLSGCVQGVVCRRGEGTLAHYPHWGTFDDLAWDC